MKKKMTCIVCPVGCALEIEEIEGEYIVTGNKCKRGHHYAIEELTAPKRIITSTVKVKHGIAPVTSVKTSKGVPKDKIFEVMSEISKAEIKAPVAIGDVVIKDVLSTGVDIVVTKACEAK